MEGLVVFGVDGFGFEIGGGDLGEFDVDVFVAVEEDSAEGEGGVVGGEESAGDLVEEGVELLVVVLVDEGDVDVFAAGEFAGGGEASEIRHRR